MKKKERKLKHTRDEEELGEKKLVKFFCRRMKNKQKIKVIFKPNLFLCNNFF